MDRERVFGDPKGTFIKEETGTRKQDPSSPLGPWTEGPDESRNPRSREKMEKRPSTYPCVGWDWFD